MDIVYLLDKVQKHEEVTREQAARLHELKLVEGRYPPALNHKLPRR